MEAVVKNQDDPTEKRVLNTCLQEFNPEQDDEISLGVGDKVEIIKKFQDGWAHGINLKTGKDGIFPMSCVSEQRNSIRSSVYSDYSKRQSSLIFDGRSTLNISSLYSVV